MGRARPTRLARPDLMGRPLSLWPGPTNFWSGQSDPLARRVGPHAPHSDIAPPSAIYNITVRHLLITCSDVQLITHIYNRICHISQLHNQYFLYYIKNELTTHFFLMNL